MAALGNFPASLRSRRIEEGDRRGVTACLCRGFPERGETYWTQALERLSALPLVDDLPRYGYVLEADCGIVGVLLTIYSRHHGAQGDEIRCNLSSWCVDDAYRSYGAKLVTGALKRRDITYTNISPAPATRKAGEALGFRRFSNGQFVFLPRLNAVRAADRISEFCAQSPEADLLSCEAERRLLFEHAELGCLSLVCISDGRVSPFIFKPRRIWRGKVSCHQVVYCRSTADLAFFAGLIGRHLRRRGAPLCLVDALGPVPGLRGWFFSDRGPKYYKGPRPPWPGDLTYTEMVLFD